MQPGTPCDRLYATIATLALVTTPALAAPAPAPEPVAAAPAAMVPATIDGWVPGSKLTLGGNVTETVRTGWRYGFAVAMNDRYAVIGAPDTPLLRANNSTVNGAGSAYVYKRTPGTNTWTFAQRLIAPELSLCQTGSAVAIDPITDDIIVGAWAYGGAATFGGGAFVYSKAAGSDSWGVPTTFPSTGSNTRMPSQELLPEDLQSIDQFGFSVAMDNGTAVVGCPLSGTSNTGALYVFRRQGDGSYLQTQKLTDPVGGSNDQLGTKVSISGNLIAAGVQNDDVYGKVNAGSAIVWKRAAAGSAFAAAGRILPSTVTAGAQFGAGVAILDGATDYLVVGAPTDVSDNTSGNGAAYVFTSADGETWSQDAALTPRIANVNNNFGYSVAMSRSEPPAIVVGAPGYDTALQTGDADTPYAQIVNAGAGFCFMKDGAEWVIRGTGDTTGDLWSPAIVNANTSIGRAVAIGPVHDQFALVGGELPTGTTGNMWSFRFANAPIGTDPGNVAGPASGPLDENGLPPDGSTPGNGGNGTGGGINGGGAPSGGTDTGAAVVTPLSPIVLPWGTVKASAIAIKGNRIAVLQTDGKHAGNKPTFRSLGDIPAGCTFVGIGDVNGDRSGDILFVTADNVLKYWQRDGLVIKDTKTIDALPPGYDVVGVADLNNDGKSDILLRNGSDPLELTVWYMSGGAISASTDYTLPAGDWEIILAKFRSATATDIVIRDAAAKQLRILADSAGTVTFPALSDRGRGWKLQGIADFNADGKQDVLWSSGSSMDVDLYTTDEAGAPKVLRRERTGLKSGTVVDIRDWNGDGKPDLWMRNGKRNWVQYTQYTVRVFSNGSRDIGKPAGDVIGFADR